MKLRLAIAALCLAGCDLFVPLALSPVGGSPNWVELRSDQNLKTEVDVLFVLDDSFSMSPKVEAFKQRFPDLINVFNDFAAKGQPASYHFGVVTTDLGAPGLSCGSNLGAKLQRIGRATTRPSGCEGPVGVNYVDYNQRTGENNLPGTQSLAQTFSCMASVVDPEELMPAGHVGCGFEMPLEAAYRALRDPIPENQGFLRPNSILAVLFLTDEDDCSADPDSDVFAMYPSYGPLNSYRCARYGIVCDGALLPELPQASFASCAPATPAQGSKLTDVQKYIDFFTRSSSQGGVRTNPLDVVLASIAAPPAPFGTQAGTGSKLCGQGVASCTVVNPSCSADDNAAVFTGDPAVRLNAVVSATRTGSSTSICDTDYKSALEQIGTRIVATLKPSCLPRPLTDTARPNCIVEDRRTVDGVEQKPTPIARCADAPDTRPCWRADELVDCPAVCNPLAGTYQQYAVRIDRGGAQAPPDTTGYVACEVQPETENAQAACALDLGSAPDL